MYVDRYLNIFLQVTVHHIFKRAFARKSASPTSCHKVRYKSYIKMLVQRREGDICSTTTTIPAAKLLDKKLISGVKYRKKTDICTKL